MTVAGYNIQKRQYGCVWINESGAPNGFDISAEALTLAEDEVPAEDAALREESNRIALMLDQTIKARDAALAELATYKDASVRAVMHARRVLEVVRGDARADDIVCAIADQFIDLKKDANLQIERAQQRLKEAGLA